MKREKTAKIETDDLEKLLEVCFYTWRRQPKIRKLPEQQVPGEWKENLW